MIKLKMLKSGLALVTLTSVLLSACGGKDNSSASNSPIPSSSQGAEGSKNVKPMDKLALNWFIPAPANANLPNNGKDFVKKKIEEMFNVELKVSYMTLGSDYNSKMNALFASDTPDMWRDGNADGGQKLAVDGLLAELSKFVTPATMPNYYKHWISEEEVTGYQSQGKFFRAPLPYNKNSVYRAYYIRKDWLDKLGLKVPTNYEDYIKALRAFTFNDPDGNGKQDTYGFSTFGAGLNLGYDWPEYIKHGLIFPSFIENNQLVDGSMHPKMEEVLNDVANLIDEKVVDPDWYLNKSPQHIEKAIQGKIGVVMSATKNFAYDNNQQGIQFRSRQLNPNADWQPFTMFPDTPLGSKPGPSFPFLFAKSVAEKNPQNIERSVAILDWLASEEGYLLTHYGEEGKHYTKEGKTIKLNLEAYDKDVTKQGDFLEIWSFFTPDAPEQMGLTVLDPTETDRDRNIAKFLTSLPMNPYIGATLTAPQGFDLTGFRKRQNELFSKAVFDDKSGKNWSMYREELLTKYKAKELFEKYTEDLRKAGAIK
jgi:ABC-type glycerol-3-phosphate transport system substrate-binding protein